MAITISVALQKGGVGKTTTAQTLASILGSKNNRVLLVDMDSQCNSSFFSGVEEPEFTIIDLLANDCKIDEATISCDYYDFLSGDERLANIEKLDEVDINLLKDTLSVVQDNYDYIIIDTPPALGNLLECSLMASNYVIISTDPRPFAVRGLDALKRTIEAVQASNKALKVLGILLVRYNERTVLNRQLKEILDDRASQMNTTVFTTFIRECIAVPEAQAMCMSLIDYAPKSNPFIDYKSFTEEVIERIGVVNNG